MAKNCGLAACGDFTGITGGAIFALTAWLPLANHVHGHIPEGVAP